MGRWAPMSPSERDDADAAGQERRLDEVAAELYALRPDTFVATRDEQVKLARAEGDAALARQVARLRRPTQSAWLVNALWRDQPEAIEELFQLAERFQAALAQGAAQDLHELMARRRSIEAALTKRARALAADADVVASADMLREVQETLAAALADPEVAAEVRTGRLVRPVTYAGFGPGAPQLRVVDGGKAERGADRRAAKSAGETQSVAAERRVQAAEQALEAAAAELAERTWEAAAAAALEAELREDRDQVRARLRDLDQRQAAAQSRAATEARRRDRAERDHEKARAALEKAKRQRS